MRWPPRYSALACPTDSIVKYETALKSDKFLVIAHGTADEVAKAKSILETAGAAQTDVHSGISGAIGLDLMSFLPRRCDEAITFPRVKDIVWPVVEEMELGF